MNEWAVEWGVVFSAPISDLSLSDRVDANMDGAPAGSG